METRTRDDRVHSVDLQDLILDERPANRGTPRGRQALDRSLQRLGAGRSVVIDREGRVIVGNKVVERARQLGFELQVVQTDGSRIVAVQRQDLDLLTDARARELGIAENRVAELDLDWDPDVLHQLQDEGFDLSPFWSDDEFDALTGSLDDRGDRDENAVIEPPVTDIARGDLFALGPLVS